MYVILKGRVAVEQHSESTGGVPIVIAILTDGIHFGELSLLDNTSIENNTQKTFCVNQLGNQQFSGRAATCVTAEKCDLLVLDHEISLQLYQLNSTEQLQSKRTQNEEQSSTFLGDNISGRATQDFLSRKIRALQAVPYFSDVEPKILKNIAANLQIRTYLYGQCIQKKGEVPPGLFIILKGQCRVVAQIIARRKLPQKLLGEKGSEDQKIDYNKIRIIDKTIFNFNPITTFLNQTAYSEVAFQNQNLYLDKNGKEIKEELEFIDFMKFRQMKKGDFFGGRVLVPFQHFSNLKKLIFGNKSQEICYSPGKGRPKIDAKDEEIYHMKSLLSVVADSQIVEVWIIDKKMMEYLKEKDLKRIYEKIVQDNEADRPYHEKDIEYVIEQNKQFDKYKIDLVETMKKSKGYEKYFKGGT